MFSIIIPTWNNLAFAKLCVESIRKNSAFTHQVILHVNDGNDGTLQWAKEQGIDHTWTPGNAGICIAVNEAGGCKARLHSLHERRYVCMPGLGHNYCRRDKKAGYGLFYVFQHHDRAHQLQQPLRAPQRLWANYRNIQGRTTTEGVQHTP